MLVLQVLTYTSLIVFVVAILQRALRIANAPVHLRWELYPVPHEKGRAHYGGSKAEEVDWWTKEHKKDHFNELKEMLSEIILLKGVKEHNKSLWVGSWPFHIALYLLMANMALLVIAGIMTLSGTEVSKEAGGLASILWWKIDIIAWAGSIIGVLGSVRLLASRIIDKGLATYSTASHYFNIILIGGIFLTLLLWLINDPMMIPNLIGYYKSVVTFSAIENIPTIGMWHIVLSLIFLLYLPFTHMTHFFTKYFIYHKIRWEDTPNVSGSAMQGEITKMLNQKVTWAAPHIGSDGSKTWLAIAMDSPQKEEEKKDE